LHSIPSGMRRELEGRYRIGLAETYMLTNRFREAESMVESAIALSSSGHYLNIEWQAVLVKGKLLKHAGKQEEAQRAFQQAIEILEKMRLQITPVDLRQSFFMDRFDPYKTMVDLLYSSGHDKEKTLEFVDRAKSITLTEHLALQEYQGKTKYDSSLSKEFSNYPTIEYFFTNERLLVFPSYLGRTEAISLDISRKELSGHIDRFLESIKTNNSTEFVRYSRLLYDLLIAPVEKFAFSDSRKALMILPDGQLHLLPFAGLMDRQGHFLIEKTPIAFAPSFTVFRYCLSARKEKAGRPHIVLIDGSSMLSGAREEMRYVSKIFGNNASILSPRELPLFRDAVAQSDIIHFSGHTITVQGKPVLLLQSSPDKRYLDCQTINDWKMPHSYLVNLAGCSTGIGPLSEGEAPWGLIPAFLNAGAPSIIASLMPVDDASTRRLNYRFYDLLQKGAGKAKALQGAQLELLYTAKENPKYWAPYFLVGDPQ